MSCTHFGEGDVSPAWQALREIASKSSIFIGKDISPPMKKLKKKLTLKTIFFTGRCFSPSSNTTRNKVPAKTTIFRGECTPPQFRGRDNFVRILPEHSTNDVGKEDDCKGKDDFEVEEVSENGVDKDFSDLEDSDDLEDGCTENEPAAVSQKYSIEEDEQPCKDNVEQFDPEVITCPWKKLAIVLSIFSFLVLMILINTQIQLYVDFFDNLTRDLTTFFNAFWKEPEPVKEFPSFVERCQRALSSQTSIPLLEMLSKIDIIGVLSIAFVIFVIIP